MFFSKKKMELLQKEHSLAEKERELEERETHINQLVKDRLANLILDISRRDYLASTLVFQNIRTEPDLSRLCSSMTQDIKILSLFNIEAKIKGGSGNEYNTSLKKCSCKDFENHDGPCKHMYRLAAEVGALLSKDCIDLESSLQKKIEELIEKEADVKKAKAREKAAKDRAVQQQEKMQQEKTDLSRLLAETTLDFPWLAEQYTKFIHDKDTALEQALRIKQHPAYVAADQVKDIKKEHAAAVARCKSLEARIRMYHAAFPILDDLESLPPKEAYRTIRSNCTSRPNINIQRIWSLLPHLSSRNQKLILAAIEGMIAEIE